MTDTATETTQTLQPWQPRTMSKGSDYASLAETAISISEFEQWTKTECNELISKPFLIVDVKMTKSDLDATGEDEYAQVFLLDQSGTQRYFSSSSLPIVQTVRNIVEQGTGGRLIRCGGLASKTVPFKAHGLPDGRDRPAFESYRFLPE